MNRLLYFYVEDERTIGILEETEEDYRNARIYRDGQWVKEAPLELIHSTRPCDREFAVNEIGEEAVSKGESYRADNRFVGHGLDGIELG